MDSNELLMKFRERQKKFEAWLPQVARVLQIAQDEVKDLCITGTELADFLDAKLNEAFAEEEVVVFVDLVDEDTDTIGEVQIDVMEFDLVVVSYLIILSWNVENEQFFVRVLEIELKETEFLSADSWIG